MIRWTLKQNGRFWHWICSFNQIPRAFLCLGFILAPQWLMQLGAYTAPYPSAMWFVIVGMIWMILITFSIVLETFRKEGREFNFE